MQSSFCLRAIVGTVVLASLPAHTFAQGVLPLPSIGGMVMAADAKTLLIAVPSTGKIIYVNTIEGKEVKAVDVGFQPATVARQGKTLFVAVLGAATIHAIDIETGKKVKEFQVGGEAIESLSCHGTNGLLYATNKDLEVIAIDPASGKISKTKANGLRVAIDPANEKFVYTNLTHTVKSRLIIQELPGGKAFQLRTVPGKSQHLLMKYEVTGADLKCLAVNDNAATTNNHFDVSRDGKLIAAAGQYKAPKQKGITHTVAGFDTSSLTTLKGQYQLTFVPTAIAFHRQLDLVALVQTGNKSEYAVFDSSSFVKVASFKVPKTAKAPIHMVFGGEGAKLISAVTLRSSSGKETISLEFHPLPLTGEQRAELKRSLSK